MVNNKLKMKIKDNGKGITEEQVYNPSSLGLMGMFERSHACGGDMRIIGTEGKGTTITLTIPFDEGKSE